MAARADKQREDAGEAEVQRKADEANQKGYYGSVPDPRPNSDYSLASGPNSPSAAELQADALERRAKEARDSISKGA